MRSDDPTPCFEQPNGSCRAEHVLGDFGIVNHDLTLVTLNRVMHSADGVHVYVAVEFSEAGEDMNLSLSLDQARALAALLGGTVDMYELHRVADALLHMQVTA